MPNSVIEKIEKEIATNRRRMTEAVHACSKSNTPENWRLYEQALLEYYRAYVNKGAAAPNQGKA
jgi:hypothetical protein